MTRILVMFWTISWSYTGHHRGQIRGLDPKIGRKINPKLKDKFLKSFFFKLDFGDFPIQTSPKSVHSGQLQRIIFQQWIPRSQGYLICQKKKNQFFDYLLPFLSKILQSVGKLQQVIFKINFSHFEKHFNYSHHCLNS